MDFLLKIPDVAEVEEKDGEITLVRAAPMQCDNHVKELVANQVGRGEDVNSVIYCGSRSS